MGQIRDYNASLKYWELNNDQKTTSQNLGVGVKVALRGLLSSVHVIRKWERWKMNALDSQRERVHVKKEQNNKPKNV